MGEARRVAKPRRVAATAKQPPEQRNAEQKSEEKDPWGDYNPDLLPGDTIEFTATVEIKDSAGRSYWPKAGVTTQVRPGEGVQKASERAARFVHNFLEEQAKKFIEEQ